MPLPPLDHLEGQRGRTLGGGGFEDGISHPLLITSSSPSGSSSYSQLFPGFHQGKGASWGGSFPHREGSCQACSPLSGLLQLSFCSLEDNGLVETSNRPFTSEPLRLANAVEDEDQPVGSSCSTEERLDDLYRSEECIPTAVVFSGLLWIERFTSSRHFVLASPWPLMCSPGSWLLCLSCFTTYASGCSGTWMIS